MFRLTSSVALSVMLAIVFPDRGRGGTANPSYYMILFANEGPGHEPWLSHTFAAFIKATGTGPDMKKYQLETHAISWLPASQDVACRTGLSSVESTGC